MGLPAEGIEALYRNNIDDVARFLNSKHSGQYMIWNLAERTYNYSKFHNAVQELGFNDHNNPPLMLLFLLCSSIDAWLRADAEEHVAVVHCLAGKGRTGLTIACYLLYSRIIPTIKHANEALAFFKARRHEGVHNPCQAQYCGYFEQILNRTVPLSRLHRSLVMSKIVLHNPSPAMLRLAQQPGGLKVEVYSLRLNGPNNVRKDLLFSATQPEFADSLMISYRTPADLVLQGDIIVKIGSGASNYCRFSFHTGFVEGVLRLNKREIDDTDRLPLPDNFLVDLIMRETEEKPMTEEETVVLQQLEQLLEQRDRIVAEDAELCGDETTATATIGPLESMHGGNANTSFALYDEAEISSDLLSVEASEDVTDAQTEADAATEREVDQESAAPGMAATEHEATESVFTFGDQGAATADVISAGGEDAESPVASVVDDQYIGMTVADSSPQRRGPLGDVAGSEESSNGSAADAGQQ